MSLDASARARVLTAAALSACLGSAAVVAPTVLARPALADPALPTSTPVSHPETDRMGSTLRAHAPSAVTAAAPRAAAIPAGTRGLDVSGWQGDVDWAAVRRAGALFAYAKATEGTSYTNPHFAQQYNGSYGAGLVRGAYHFALPDRSGGREQADFFVDHGGGWSDDGRTLPPLLDIEYDPYGPTCYGLSRTAMVAWITTFSKRVHWRTGRFPAIYTTTDWWRTCTGDDASLGRTDPLFLARYASSPGVLPAGWSRWTFWQYADSGDVPGDQDVFQGTATRLRTFASGGA